MTVSRSNNYILLNDYGTIQPTKQLALNAAVNAAYQKLKIFFDFQVLSM